MLPVAFPYAIAAGGQTARASFGAYLEQLLEQIVFVEPGERVNRPDFGCGLRRLVFERNAGELTTAVEALVQTALRQWTGPAIGIQGVDVAIREGLVRVTVRYLELASGRLRQVTVADA